ncbi:MAG: response regulator [Spirochaetia bacterium]|jgi:two-component system response regulator YesN
MARLVLVEDEQIIRTGIATSVDWAGLGIDPVGEAEDGEQALALVERIRPDIIITDIRIPFIDGLELIERVKARISDVSVIIISGYDDFRYAQRALKLGVQDYILKPVDPEELTRVLRRICAERERSKTAARELVAFRETEGLSRRLIQERLLRDILDNRLTRVEGLAGAAREMFPLPGRRFAVLIAQLDDHRLMVAGMGGRESRELELAFADFLRIAAEREPGLFHLEDGDANHLVCASAEADDVLRQKIDRSAARIRQSAARLSGVTVSIGIGGIHEGPEGLRLSFEEATKAIAYTSIAGKDRVIAYEAVPQPGGTGPLSVFSESELIWAVKLSDEEGIRANIELLLRDLLRAGDRIVPYLQMYVSSILTNCIGIIMEEGGSVEEVVLDPVATWNGVLAHQTAAEVLNALREQLLAIAHYLEADRTGSQHHALEKAKKYIKRHYGRCELSLEEVARSVNLSASYFSSIFSKNEGVSFIHYLSRIRLERAKEMLLRTAYKTYEIADMVGYPNPTYFSSLFKRYAGLRPTEYRKNASAARSAGGEHGSL